MKQYNITVNGKTYQVEVEEVNSAASATVQRPSAPQVTYAPQTPAPAAAPAVPAAPATPAAPAAPPREVPAGGTVINSPMPGTILDIRTSEGKSVKTGDVLMILEAMKMENEIMAPHDGTVTAIHAVKGASVNAGDVLVVLG